MSSFIATFAHRAICPMIKHRHFSSLSSSLATSLAAPRKTLTPSRILSPISVPCAFSKAVDAGDKIRRTDSNEDILRVLEDKIDVPAPAPLEAEFPKDSPFMIIDNPGKRSIKLKREFQGEKIEVYVYKNFDGDADRQPHIPLLVTIDKAGAALKFWCNLYAKDFEIEKIMMKRPKDSDAEKAYEGHDCLGCSDLDEGLRKAFNEYLGARGINVSLYKFLQEYFMTVDDRLYIFWMKNVKEFVEKVASVAPI